MSPEKIALLSFSDDKIILTEWDLITNIIAQKASHIFINISRVVLVVQLN